MKFIMLKMIYKEIIFIITSKLRCLKDELFVIFNVGFQIII
jgi:hypothetical protein